MTNWRPEGWKNPYTIIEGRHQERYERSADAILEALYKQGDGNWFRLDKTFSGDILIYQTIREEGAMTDKEMNDSIVLSGGDIRDGIPDFLWRLGLRCPEYGPNDTVAFTVTMTFGEENKMYGLHHTV